MITIYADNKEIFVNWTEFSDGAITCTISNDIKHVKNYINLNVNPTTPVKQITDELNLIVNAIKLLIDKPIPISLYMPYLPYGRADRKFEEGNPEPLKVFTSNPVFLNFDLILIDDPHTTNFKLPNSEHKSQLQCFKESVPPLFKPVDVVIAPDKGAYNKASKIASYLNTSFISASKTRNVSTGKITKIDVDISKIKPNSRVLIPDDICDGGGTFIPIAENLKSINCEVILYVTHFIGSKGLNLFKNKIDKIYYKNIISKTVNREDLINFNLGQY